MNTIGTIDDYGLLIGFISVHNGKINEFFNTEFQERLSLKYRENRFWDTANTNDYKNLYHFKGYKLIGEYDLAVMSLINDFSYPNRVFHPSHGSRNSEEPDYRNYDYQIITCLNTSINQEYNVHIEDFLMSEKDLVDKYPYICITRAKLNGMFLCGNGLRFINLVKKFLISKSKNEAYQNGEFRIVVLDNMGCDELVIINYSKNITALAEFNHKIRSSCFLQLKSIDDSEACRIFENKYSNYDICSVNYNEWSAHIFTNFHSSIGYPMHETYIGMSNENENEIAIHLTWDIKPGHANALKKQIEQILLEEGFDLKILQNEPFRFNRSRWGIELNTNTMKITVNRLFMLAERFREMDGECVNTRKLHMSMTVGGIKLNENIHNNSSHLQTSQFADKVRIDDKEIYHLRENLQKVNVSKLLRERVMKMYNNYNNCILDPMFFCSFIDLYGTMKALTSRVEDFANNQNSESILSFHEWLNTQVLAFEQAYLNRFHQSNRMREMSDFNLEWNGGIQQYLSPLDVVFKTILVHYGYQHYDKFLYVSGYERVFVVENAFRINMLLVTYPELFAATIWKESFNFFWRNISKDNPQRGLYQELKIFQSKNYHKIFKERIEKQTDFNNDNWIHQSLLSSIDKDFVNDFVADFLTFYCGYNLNFADFSYWYWKYFLQTSLYYDRKTKLPDKHLFIKFLVRIILIKKLDDEINKQNPSYHPTADELLFFPADPQLSELWMETYNEVHNFTNIISRVLNWDRFYMLFQEYAIAMIYNDLHKFDNRVDLPANKVVQERQNEFEIATQKFIHCFEDNTTPIICETNSYFELITFIAAFLRYLKELDNKDAEGKTHLLIRTIEGYPDKSKYKYYSNILSDPLGGIFCPNSFVQNKCFQARALFYRVLLDLSLRNKEKQVRNN